MKKIIILITALTMLLVLSGCHKNELPEDDIFEPVEELTGIPEVDNIIEDDQIELEPEHEHVLVKIEAKPATCVEYGNIEFYICSGENGCGLLFLEDGTQIKKSDVAYKNNHTWNDGEINEPLEGVVFDLYAATTIRDTDGKVIYEENKKVGTLDPTDEEGNTSINDLYLGDYYVVETKSVFGYALNTEKQYLSIQTDDKNVGIDATVEVTNEKQKLFVKVIKTFEDTVTYYDDVEFDVYRVNDNEEYELFGTIVPDKNDQLTQLEWLPGSYYIQESKTNDNFVIDETHYKFTLSYDDSGESEIWMDLGLIENQLKDTDVIIIKTDSKDGTKLLNGAVFLVKEGDEELGFVSTGSIFIKYNEQLVPCLEAVEEETETEYVIKTYLISMNEEFNEYMEVESDENGEVLLVLGNELTEEGTYFISDGNETWSVEVVNGKAVINNLKATHTYTINEVYAPEKYELNTEPFEFTVDFTDGFTGEYTITNIKQYVPSLGF